MDDRYESYPDQRMGLIFHVLSILFILALVGLSLWQATLTGAGLNFIVYLLPSLLALAVIPYLVYRAYALRTAYYIVEREGIRLRWGLRVVQIPMDEISWVHPASSVHGPLPLPRLSWPGSVMGARKSPVTGEIEFMASRKRNLILIGASDRTYAISPTKPSEFILAYRHCLEMGSLDPLQSMSIYPTVFLERIWNTRPARLLLLSGLVLCIGLVTWVSLSISARSYIHLGFQQDGTPGEVVPSVRLLLLPLISSTFFLMDLFIGLFLFRNEKNQPLAYLVWGAGAVVSLLFLIGVFFILQTDGG